MDTVLRWLLALCVEHRAWAGPAFGLIAFGESLAILGTLIPATPILFLFGTLLGSRQVTPAIIPWAVAGAIGGYWASWAAGRRVGLSLFRSRFFRDHRRGAALARLFFRRWGAPSLIFGRYVLGPFQSMLPLAAGMAAMNPRRFHVWNTISGVTWVLVVLTPGYLAGRGMLLFGLGMAQQRTIMGALVVVSLGGVLVAVGLGALRLMRANAVRRRGAGASTR